MTQFSRYITSILISLFLCGMTASAFATEVEVAPELDSVVDIVEDGPRLRIQDVPEPLQAWVQWVLHNDPDQSCPFLYNNGNIHRCAWPDRLNLSLDGAGGRFSQSWLVLQDSWLQLPGDAKVWPGQVQVDDRAAVVVSRDGVPVVHLKKGYHRISGRLRWPQLPESLAVSPDSALVSLTVNGRQVTFPRFERQGRLWLQAVSGPVKVEDRYDLEVFRHIDDSIPSMVTVHLELNVAGRARELHLPNPFDENFVPLRLNSTLPSRVDSDGSLRIQVRPGRWVLQLTARHRQPLTELTFSPPKQDWVEEEVWVFQARPSLRIVDVEGVSATDPSQTALPDAWKALPAYAMQAGNTMRFIEKQRGDPEPAPDQLELRRDLWLSFDGDYFAVSDKIQGSKTSNWRMVMPSPYELGSVKVNGEHQFITSLTDDQRPGIELRQGVVEMGADSLVRNEGGAFSATGWEQDFSSVRARLHLPPGWRLFTASGVDRVNSSWINRWTLLDMFIVLIIAAAFGRLWGRWAGLLALVALIISYHQPGSPQWIWLFLMAGYGLLRVLPSGRARTIVTWLRNGLLLILLIMLIPYSVDEVRKGLYPQLDKPWDDVAVLGMFKMGEVVGDRAYFAEPAPEPEPEMILSENTPEPMLEQGVPSPMDSVSSVARLSEKPAKLKREARQRPRYEPGALLQTGPGRPSWTWRGIDLIWNGPVDREQELSLYLIGPKVNFTLAILRVVLLAALVLCLLQVRWRPGGGWSFPSPRSMLPVLLCGIATMFMAPNSARAEYPDQQLLDTLHHRLLADADCLPECAAIESMSLNALPARLELTLNVHSLEDVAMPLPGNRQEWLPSTVTIDGKPAQGLFTDAGGVLWLRVTIGVHRIEMTGPLPAREAVQIPLPLRPHLTRVKLEAWEADGVHEDGRTDAQIQLSRKAAAAGEPGASMLEGVALPPFILVERELDLGLTWRVVTRVRRIGPGGSAVVLQIPLLKGESVISENTRVSDGKVLLSLGRSELERVWESVLETGAGDGPLAISLAAPDTHDWVEKWSVDASPVWHLKTEGITPIHHRQGGRWLPQWRPWPGEKVTLSVSRPIGVDGQTMTIDNVRLKVTPGLRVSMAELSMHLRSSQGGRHGISLPEGSELLEVRIDEETRPLRLEEGKLYLPVTPGRNDYRISWRYQQPIAMFFTMPKVDLHMPAVNASAEIRIGGERWVLFTGGATLGPAVLIWGVIIVLALLSLALGRLRDTPLRAYHWFLLSIGLTQVSVEVGILVVVWLLALAGRKHLDTTIAARLFNSLQVALVLLTIIALAVLITGISIGLLGSPDMQIAGNGSSASVLKWYQDKVAGQMPPAWVLSVPMYVYRIAMLAWALWIAFSLLNWLRWGWQCFSHGGYWKSVQIRTGPTPGST